MNDYSYMMFYATPRCNMSCPKCMRKVYSLGMENDATWVDFTKSMDRWVEQIKPKTLVFTGGEPTLWSFLKEAISVAKWYYHIPKVIVATNGIGRNAEDYGIADIVNVSNYGSTNRADMIRLKRQLGRRFRVIPSTQLTLPFPVHKDSLPARCNCVHVCSIGDEVYPCGGAVGRVPGLHNREDYIAEFLKMDIYNQEICKSCYSNINVRRYYEPGLTIELGIWDCGSWLFGLKSHCTKFRLLMKKILRR